MEFYNIEKGTLNVQPTLFDGIPETVHVEKIVKRKLSSQEDDTDEITGKNKTYLIM